MRSGLGGRRLALACTAAAAMAFAGCGSAAEQERERSDGERARVALLRESDLPEQWTQVDVGDDETLSEQTLAEICPDYPAEWLRTDGEATASFQSDTGVVTHGVTILESGDAVAQFDDIGSERSQRCMRRALEHGLRQGQTDDLRFDVSDVDTSVLDLPGDEQGMRVKLTLTAPDQGVELPVVGDFVVDRSGDAFSTLATMSIAAPADDALRDRLAEVAAERLQESFG